MKRILREPLLHFLVLGAALFGLNALLSAHAPGRASIVVTKGRIESLATAFALTWQRPPTAQELEGLIRDYVREEVAVREAASLGLDQDDVVIRRRLRQKLEFVSGDAAAQAEPGDAELRAWLAAHPADFGTDPTCTFSQVFLDPAQARRPSRSRRGAPAREAAARRGPRGHRGGRRSVPPRPLVRQAPGTRREEPVRRGVRGEPGLAPAGAWQGPIASGLGAHLVFVHERSGARSALRGGA
jgi:hypothetical protein